MQKTIAMILLSAICGGAIGQDLPGSPRNGTKPIVSLTPTMDLAPVASTVTKDNMIVPHSVRPDGVPAKVQPSAKATRYNQVLPPIESAKGGEPSKPEAPKLP